MKNLFTTSFYRFLLGFTVIIALSFGTLLFLGTRDGTINPEPALSKEPE